MDSDTHTEEKNSLIPLAKRFQCVGDAFKEYWLITVVLFEVDEQLLRYRWTGESQMVAGGRVRNMFVGVPIILILNAGFGIFAAYATVQFRDSIMLCKQESPHRFRAVKESFVEIKENSLDHLVDSTQVAVSDIPGFLFRTLRNGLHAADALRRLIDELFVNIENIFLLWMLRHFKSQASGDNERVLELCHCLKPASAKPKPDSPHTRTSVDARES